MNADHSRLEVLLEAALERTDAAERELFLVEACRGDEALLRAARRLIAAHAAADESFLAPTPPLRRASAASAKSSVTESAGERIGPYRLVQQIGEGGFGTVWMADQEEPVRRPVALKIIKVGMDTKEVIARFEQERQALAMMDHPNIAKVFHAGATQSGRPFFAMELVRGTRITDYCDERALPVRERIQLFIRACQAVQHAHHKGVIHRDIKPSNVLVTTDEGLPVPKVIDFGVAKATQNRLTDLTIFTANEQLIGTPAYMSPEQAGLTGVDVDTRSDIYSLGVVLYELLTGRLPIDPAALHGAGVDEMRRLIREVDPLRPSTCIRSLTPSERSSVALSRQCDPARLPALFRGELDWVVMKCLEKDRARRYQTANGLALDLERYLDDEPVSARPPSGMYRIGKTMRRHRAGFLAGGVAIVALLTVAILSTYSYLRAQHDFKEQRRLQEQLAEIQERKAFEEVMRVGLMGDGEGMARALRNTQDRIRMPQFLLLRGGHELMSGQYDVALHDLAEAARMDPKSTAALGLLATGLFLNGQWEGYERAMATLRPMPPDQRYPEDRIFKGLALGYGWPEEAIALLDDAPPAPMTQAVRGEVGVWHALRSGRAEDALAAVAAIGKARSFAPKNPSVLRMSVSARLIAGCLDAQNRLEHEKLANAEASELQAIFASKPHAPDAVALPGAVAMRALQLQALGLDADAATLLRTQYEATRNGLIAQRHALELFRDGDTAKAAQIINPQRAAVDGFFHLRMMVELTGGDPSATEESYRAFRKRYEGLAAELFSPLIPLLLGRKDVALADARAFRDRVGDTLRHWPAPFLQIADFLAGRIDADALLRSAGTSPLALCESHNVIGYSLLAVGDRAGAQEHFRRAVEARAFLSNGFLDSRIMLARMKSDPQWPRWIPSSTADLR